MKLKGRNKINQQKREEYITNNSCFCSKLTSWEPFKIIIIWDQCRLDFVPVLLNLLPCLAKIISFYLICFIYMPICKMWQRTVLSHWVLYTVWAALWISCFHYSKVRTEETGNCSHPHLYRWGVLARLTSFAISFMKNMI